MRVLLSGGGTGGHIYPALALAKHLMFREPGSEALFVGTAAGLESKIVPDHGFALETIPARGFRRSLRQLWPTARDFYRGVRQARAVLRRFRPDVVVGTGGYVAAPVVLAAVLNRVPAVIHEQNAIPGMANRYLAPMVHRVCVSFKDSVRYLSRRSRVVLTGNPRASEVAAVGREEGRRRLGLDPGATVVLVYGGSRGALHLNRVVQEYLSRGWLLPRVRLLFVTGEIYYAQVKKELGRLPDNIILFPYLRDMPYALAAADMVITRSGATTLAEITALGVPAILVPSPNVVHDHQYYNARVLADAGAAVLLREEEFNALTLRKEMERLLAAPEALRKMAAAAAGLGIVDAAERFYRCLREIAPDNNTSGSGIA